MRVLLVTGMSGAGKSSALKLLEDLGYEAVDNLPLSLIGRLIDPANLREAGTEAIAVSADFRTRDFSSDSFAALMDRLIARPDLRASLLFLDCDDDVLARRFTETRRRHPLADDRPVVDGIRLERELLAATAKRADLVVDTSSLAPHDLRRLLAGHFSLASGNDLTVSMLSFSYRTGLPREADLVFDVRFLANPHYIDELRPGTGRDAPVGEYIARDAAYTPFMESVSQLLLSLLPHYQREGKSYLTVAIGCTGGRHRSVFVAEQLTKRLADAGRPVILRHRDLSENETG